MSPSRGMVFRGRRLSPIWHAILRVEGRNELFDCRRGREGGTKNRIPRSRHFSRRRDATTRQKSEIISRENSPPDSVHFSWRRGVDGNWLPPWPSPLPSFSLLLLLLRFFAPPTSSSSSLLLSRWFIESVNDSSPLFLITRANSALPRLSWRIDFEEKVWKEASVLISFQGTRCSFCFSSMQFRGEEFNLEEYLFSWVNMENNWKMIETVDNLLAPFYQLFIK